MNVLCIGPHIDAPVVKPQGGSQDTGLSGGPMPGLSQHDQGLGKAEVPMTGRGRILLVDDSDPVRETLADLLEVEGFQAAQASSAAEAMTLLRQDPHFDVLVTDLSMPGDDGIALIHQARQVQPTLPAILLTGYAEEMSSVAVIPGANFQVLRKPVEGDRLIEQITSLMK
jgi:DNA-binding NtrC family response regulator